MTISQGKHELEKLELQSPVAAGPQDIPHGSVARPEPAGALFRYINCILDYKSLQHKVGYIYSSHSMSY